MRNLPRQKIELTEEGILEQVRICNSWQEVADALGVSVDVLRRERKRFHLGKEFSDVKIKYFQDIPPDYLDKIIGTEIRDVAKLNYIVIECDGNFVIIVPFGDTHWGHQDCDKSTLKIVLEWIYQTKNVYIICMGDLIESSIIGSPGLFDQEKFVDSQMYDIVKMLKPIADEGRIIGLLEGNHEKRIRKLTGFDITKLMAELLDTQYLGKGMAHLIEVTNGEKTQQYTMYTTHGKSNARYPHTKMNSCINMNKIVNVECYCMGHVHTLGHQKIDTFEIDKQNKSVKKEPKHYVLTGSYLHYWGSYAQAEGYPPSGDTGSPKIKLHIDTHRISVSL